MKQLQLKDFLNYRFLSSVSFAPGGKKAAFVVANANEEENGYESRLWLYEEGKGVRQLTDLGKEGRFIWEDDEHILFPAVRSAAERKRAEKKDRFTSYYRLDLNGGEALPAFTLPIAAGEMKYIANGVWLVSGKIDANCPDYYKMTAEERADYQKAIDADKDYEVFDEVPFWSNGRGITNKDRSALFLYNACEDKLTRVTEPLFSAYGSLVDGEKVLYLGAAYTLQPNYNRSTLYALDYKTGESKEICKYEEFSAGGLTKVGDKIYLLGTDGKRHGINENRWVYTLDPDTGALTVLHEDEYSMYSSVGSDCRFGGGKEMMAKGDVLYHLTTREGCSYLYAIAPDGSQSPIVTREGSIDEIALSDNADYALMVAMYDTGLQELYKADLATGETEKLTAFNEAALKDTYVAKPIPLSVRSEGYEIGGWVLLPKDYDETKTYPAVLDIHGGPKTAYGPVFYHEMQLWANMGYFVFYCNPKGSDGRDGDFMDIRGHYGETDYKNIMDFTDGVLAAYPQIDKAKVCVTGGSYGGFMTNWIIGHTDRFCCAASQRSIANWISFYGISDIGIRFGMDQCDADPWGDPAKMWEHSPMAYANNVKTPTVFIHSDEDYRCPIAEGYQMYTSLIAQGVPARLVTFHGENHELSRSGKPTHRVRRLTEITNWFEKYAK